MHPIGMKLFSSSGTVRPVPSRAPGLNGICGLSLSGAGMAIELRVPQDRNGVFSTKLFERHVDAGLSGTAGAASLRNSMKKGKF